MRGSRSWTTTAITTALGLAASGCVTGSKETASVSHAEPVIHTTSFAERAVPPVLIEQAAGIRVPTSPPPLPPLPAPAADLPDPPRLPAEGSLPPPAGVELTLDEVLASVAGQFPLLVSAELERGVAAGQRLSAEGAFDLAVRGRALSQTGTFPSERLDLGVEQPTLWGPSVFAGYRRGRGDFPVYYGDRLTAEGGEFRAGVSFPLLRDSSIDRRRAALRQGQLGEALADPFVQRARIDFLRAGARAYWAWVGAGIQVRVNEALLRIGRDRQDGLEEQYRKGQIPEFAVIDNRRLIAEREGALIAADRRWQQAAFELSLYLRDPSGSPIVPGAERLPRDFFTHQPLPPDPGRLAADVQTAVALRPELTRFRLLKERAMVELRLAENQHLPALNAGVAGAQDVGIGKKGEGANALDRTNLEAFVALEVPLQRREARGREQSVRANLGQLLAQERYARDQIEAEVKDAVSSLEQTFQRLAKAREEQAVARRVADLETERFRKGQSTLLEVNLREVSAAGAASKVVEALADYYRAVAEYRAALGLDARPEVGAWSAFGTCPASPPE